MASKNVSLREETYRWLDEWRSPGQSFDGAIRELRERALDTPEAREVEAEA